MVAPHRITDDSTVQRPVLEVIGSLEMQDGRFLDTNRDGVYDRWEQDADGDGIAERSGRLERRDGEVYLRDEEGNPLPAQRAEPLNDAVMEVIDMAPEDVS
ncbi:MAG: hypothetical protein GY745_13535 [Actinomycetia bacterium]|nr:hypothetical protein [Actinomycetes bacterium]